MRDETYINDHELGVRVIIEGPECVGKDYFINKLVDYLEKPTNIKANKQVMWDPFTHKAITGSKRFIKKRSKRIVKKMLKRATRRDVEYTLQSKWSDTISFCVIDPWQSCPESKAFQKRIHETQVDPKEVAEEFLQIHYDYELFARDMEKIYNLVIMNRGLASYKANQIVTDGFVQFEENYEKLKRFSYQEDAFFIALTAPADVIKSRYTARRSKDFRGEIEDKYIAQLNKAFAVYQEEMDSGHYTKAVMFDTTQDESAYERIFEEIVRFVSAQMRGSMVL